MITQEILKQEFEYNPLTGVVIHKKDKGRNKVKGKVVGTLTEHGYLQTSYKNKKLRLHRLAWIYMYGDIPKNMQIDHINGDRADNRIENLRVVTSIENSHNMSKSKANKSGTTGVFWRSDRNRWYSMIKVDGHNIHLGSFAKYSDAVDARKNAEALYGFHYNHGKEVSND